MAAPAQGELPGAWFLAPFVYLPLPPLVVGLLILVGVEASYLSMELLAHLLDPAADGEPLSPAAS